MFQPVSKAYLIPALQIELFGGHKAGNQSNQFGFISSSFKKYCHCCCYWWRLQPFFHIPEFTSLTNHICCHLELVTLCLSGCFSIQQVNAYPKNLICFIISKISHIMKSNYGKKRLAWCKVTMHPWIAQVIPISGNREIEIYFQCWGWISPHCNY